MNETKPMEETKPANRVVDVSSVNSEPEQDPTMTVDLSRAEWVAVIQLISVGVRQADDSVLELGGRLLRQIKSQLQPSTNGKA